MAAAHHRKLGSSPHEIDRSKCFIITTHEWKWTVRLVFKSTSNHFSPSDGPYLKSTLMIIRLDLYPILLTDILPLSMKVVCGFIQVIKKTKGLVIVQLYFKHLALKNNEFSTSASIKINYLTNTS